MVKVTKQFGFHAEHNSLNYFSIHAYPPPHFKSHVDTLHSTATAFIKNVAYLLPYFSTAFDRSEASSLLSKHHAGRLSGKVGNTLENSLVHIYYRKRFP